jgi:predicted O-methyltransferase YrrM
MPTNKADVIVGALGSHAMGFQHLEGLVNKAKAAGHGSDGTTSATVLSFLAGVASDPKVKLVGEIGFNGGFSSYAFLSANPEASVYSFDLCQFEYSVPAKQHIDSLFPGRHKLITGDSTTTVPEFGRTSPGTNFDLIFVDGGHSYDIARQDLRNMQSMATSETTLIVDDLTPWKPWGQGPTRAWQEALKTGLVIQELIVQDGIVVTTAESSSMRSRVWAVGRYTKETDPH